MAKIVLSMDGVVLQEMVLSKERTTIGRRPHNDLVIDNSTISAEHAVIVTLLQDAYLEDLNSTNGTRVNGQPIAKHFLKNNDVLELAKYKIRFVREEEGQDDGAALLDVTRKISDIPSLNIVSRAVQQRVYRDGNTVAMTGAQPQINAVINILSGPNAGKQIALVKPLTTIGLSGLQVAVVTRYGKNYNLTHIEGDTYPLVNGISVGPSAYTMTSGDVIDLLGTRMEFVQT